MNAKGAFLLLLLALPVSAQEVIVNAGVPESAMSRTDMQAIFGLSLREWPDGSPIRVFALPDDNALHVAFSKNILNLFPHQLRRTWDRIVFSGRGEAPTGVKSAQEMLDRVANTPGAIGYLPDNYPLPQGKEVRIVEVK